MVERETVLVVNPTAGRNRAARRRDEIVELLEAHPAVGSLSVVDPASERDCAECLSELAAGPARTVVAGGDGMVHLAVQAFACSDAEFGIIPVGTGNDFADAVGLPRGLSEAVDASLRVAGAVDAVEVTAGSSSTAKWWGATVVTFGFAATVNERAERMRFPRGPSRYTVATVVEIGRLEASGIRLVVDGAVTELDATLVAIANTSTFGGGMQIAPDADHTDGLLDVIVIGAVPRRTLLRVLPKAFSGGHVGHPAVTSLRGVTVEVSGANQRVRADGEALCELPMVATARRGALRVAGVSSAG